MKEPSQANPVRIDPLLAWLKATPKDLVESQCQQHGVSLSYLRQIAYGYKQAGLMAAAIEQMTDNAVTRRDLRPDDWHRIWPELAEREPSV